MTHSELLKVIYRFYPRGLQDYDPSYDATEERRHLADAAIRARIEYTTWERVIHPLGARYSLQNESLHLLAGGLDPAYSARIYLPRETISFHVSFLGPYYGVHHLGESDEAPAAIARQIEAVYPGHAPIPPDLGDEVIPDLGLGSMPFGTSTIYLFLLSRVWEWGGVREP